MRSDTVTRNRWWRTTGSALDLEASSSVLVTGNRVAGMKFNNIAVCNVDIPPSEPFLKSDVVLTILRSITGSLQYFTLMTISVQSCIGAVCNF